ncbi:hypothetical protein F5Y12DRAFT_715699 [Xylaria sp. FL1777]|nr:hypothetical protein F5Y12DRAFT_715699 [Xylaria sp. FL1777]
MSLLLASPSRAVSRAARATSGFSLCQILTVPDANNDGETATTTTTIVYRSSSGNNDANGDDIHPSTTATPIPSAPSRHWSTTEANTNAAVENRRWIGKRRPQRDDVDTKKLATGYQRVNW